MGHDIDGLDVEPQQPWNGRDESPKDRCLAKKLPERGVNRKLSSPFLASQRGPPMAASIRAARARTLRLPSSFDSPARRSDSDR